jgi:hypothetical protein
MKSCQTWASSVLAGLLAIGMICTMSVAATREMLKKNLDDYIVNFKKYIEVENG